MGKGRDNRTWSWIILPVHWDRGDLLYHLHSLDNDPEYSVISVQTVLVSIADIELVFCRIRVIASCHTHGTVNMGGIWVNLQRNR